MKADRALIEVKNLCKSYPSGFWRRRIGVLNDVSFSVGENEVVGFLGANGAGKTTTIKVINCLAFPDSGTVRLFGEEGGVRSASRRRIGFMPEQPYFYEYLTGMEFLGLCGRLNGLGDKETRKRATAMIERVGLAAAGGTAIRKYSKGMMQRLGLAQALLHDPELVILDEPMSGLDPMGRMDVRAIISELKAAGKTVFFSTHIISDVEALCDRVILLDRGRKLAEGSVAELVGNEVQYIELVFSAPPGREVAADAGPLHPRRARRRRPGRSRRERGGREPLGLGDGKARRQAEIDDPDETTAGGDLRGAPVRHRRKGRPG